GPRTRPLARARRGGDGAGLQPGRRNARGRDARRHVEIMEPAVPPPRTGEAATGLVRMDAVRSGCANCPCWNSVRLIFAVHRSQLPALTCLAARCALWVSVLSLDRWQC